VFNPFYSKGLNRTAGTLVAGIIALCVNKGGPYLGEVYPYFVVLCVFVGGSIPTFFRFRPPFKERYVIPLIGLHHYSNLTLLLLIFIISSSSIINLRSRSISKRSCSSSSSSSSRDSIRSRSRSRNISCRSITRSSISRKNSCNIFIPFSMLISIALMHTQMKH
jgi:hypothetical protein